MVILTPIDNQDETLSAAVSKKPMVETSNFVTNEQLDNKLGSVVDQIINRIEPKSELTPEGKSFIKTVGEIHNITEALKSPTTAGIEQATGNLVTKVLGNALQNITGGEQQVVQQTSLKSTLAQIAINNLTGENSPLPQIMDAATSILGKDKVREGYDAGMQYIDQQQNKSNLPNVILQLNENSQEDVVAYAQQMGYSDVGYAQGKLIEHKNRLYQEIEERQNIQQGGQQTVVQEPNEQRPQQEEQYVEKPIVKEQYVEEPVVQPERFVEVYNKEPIIQENVIQENVIQENVDAQQAKELLNEKPLDKEPIEAINRVITKYYRPKKLTLASNIDNNMDNSVDNSVDSSVDNSVDSSVDNNIDDIEHDIDKIISELGEQDE